MMIVRAIVFILAQMCISKVCAQSFDTTNKKVDSRTISVLYSNNQTLDIRSALYPYAFSPSDAVAQKLHAFCSKEIRIESTDEGSKLDSLLQWVHLHLSHDPFNSVAQNTSTFEILERASKGEKFTCVEFAKVLCDVLTSYGFAARIVGLSRRNIGNPRSGARHVGVEVWSCSQNKQVFLDPQFGLRYTKHSIWLNAKELQESMAARDSNLEMHYINSHSIRLSSDLYKRDSSYREFIFNHSAFTDIPYRIDNSVGLLMLLPVDRFEPMLFQGHYISRVEFTKDRSQLYAPMGSVHIELNVEDNHTSKVESLLSPSYNVLVTSSFPWVKYFERKVDNEKWERILANNFQWHLHNAHNEIRVRAVCTSGCTTEECHMHVFCGSRDDARKERALLRLTKGH